MENPYYDQTDLENDPRFPSGEWTGFFLQPSMYIGRMKMSLSLTFSNGKLTGEGADIVGIFFVRGKYNVDSGEVHIHKRYRGYIDVDYRGFAEKQHKGIWGVWEIENVDRGGFHIWPKKRGTETDLAEDNEADGPIEKVLIEGELSPATTDIG